MEEMVQIIQSTGEFDAGSRQPKLIAQDWLDEGFTHGEAEQWISAGCWSPPLARVMADSGIDAELAGLPTE